MHYRRSVSKNSRQEEAVKKLRTVERSNPFSISENGDGSELKLVNEIHVDVLNMETLCRKALWLFIDGRISGEMNIWDNMPKLKFLS